LNIQVPSLAAARVAASAAEAAAMASDGSNEAKEKKVCLID
jgi:hypothetical protein